MKKMTFIAAMKDFFDMKLGQPATQFAIEIREACGAQNDPRREFYIAGLEMNGYEIVPL